jgi:hypothetical protein
MGTAKTKRFQHGSAGSARSIQRALWIRRVRGRLAFFSGMGPRGGPYLNLPLLVLSDTLTNLHKLIDTTKGIVCAYHQIFNSPIELKIYIYILPLL